MPSLAKENIRQIQHALARKGFSPGPIDGIWGPMTANAVRAFQAVNDLVVDGIVGPKTSAKLLSVALDADPLNAPSIPWFQEARRLIGIREKVGPGNEPVIMEWATKAGIPYKSDDVAWCGLFVAHCVSSTLADEPLPGNPLGARQWLKFGTPCDAELGSILVFWRVSVNSWKGHVGFYAGEDSSAYHVLGGNQKNQVCIARIKKDRLLGARWPATAPLANLGEVKMASNNTMFSTNEA